MDPFIIILVVIAGALAAVWYFNRSTNNFDTNKDGQVNLDDAKKAVENTVAGVKAAADVNKDGKVNAADAKEVVTKAKKTVAKKAAPKAKPAAKKAAPKLKVAK